MNLENFNAKDLVGLMQEEAVSAKPSFGTVVATGSAGVQVRIDGETTAGSGWWKRLASYSPAIGDRVYFVRVSSSYLVIGKVI